MSVINIVNVSLEDMSQIIKNIVAEEMQKALKSITPDCKEVGDEFLTREETSRILHVSNTTLFHWNKQKILVNNKINRRVYYKKAHVMKLLNNGLDNVA